MKKLVALILATLVLLFALAGCVSKGEIFTPTSLSVEDTTASAEVNDTKETADVADATLESKADSTQDGDSDAPVIENGDLEIITHVATESVEGSVKAPAEKESDSATDSAVESATEQEEETTEREVIVLPFVPAE